MPSTYKPKLGGKTYKKVDEERAQLALDAVKAGVMSLRKAAKDFDVPYTCLQRRMSSKCLKQGGQTVLTSSEEEMLVRRLIVCAQWGYPVDTFDLRFIVKGYLDRRGIPTKRFKNNMPGKDFAVSFLKRHRHQLSERMCQNIKRARARVSREILKEYFEELKVSLEGVPPGNIVNYDETNLTDDPGRKKVISKRGTKYPERIMNHSKSATSIMMAGDGEGNLLPCYVVYRAKHLYNTWSQL